MAEIFVYPDTGRKRKDNRLLNRGGRGGREGVPLSRHEFYMGNVHRRIIRVICQFYVQVNFDYRIADLGLRISGRIWFPAETNFHNALRARVCSPRQRI